MADDDDKGIGVVGTAGVISSAAVAASISGHANKEEALKNAMAKDMVAKQAMRNPAKEFEAFRKAHPEEVAKKGASLAYAEMGLANAKKAEKTGKAVKGLEMSAWRKPGLVFEHGNAKTKVVMAVATVGAAIAAFLGAKALSGDKEEKKTSHVERLAQQRAAAAQSANMGR